jgi:hypothetical protein
LRQEGLLEVVAQERAYFIEGIATDCHGAVHHQAGLLQHLVVGILVERAMGGVGDHGKAGTEHRDEDQVEFCRNSHGSFLLWTAGALASVHAGLVVVIGRERVPDP